MGCTYLISAVYVSCELYMSNLGCTCLIWAVYVSSGLYMSHLVSMTISNGRGALVSPSCPRVFGSGLSFGSCISNRCSIEETYRNSSILASWLPGHIRGPTKDEISIHHMAQVKFWSCQWTTQNEFFNTGCKSGGQSNHNVQYTIVNHNVRHRSANLKLDSWYK